MCVLLSAKAGWEGEEGPSRGESHRVTGGQEQMRSRGKGSRYVGERREEQGTRSHWKEHKFSDNDRNKARHTA